jgi:hypothetical protein
MYERLAAKLNTTSAVRSFPGNGSAAPARRAD